MKRKCQISLVLESISCLRKTDKQGGLSVWQIVCEAVLTCHPYVSERGDLLIKEWKYSFELCVFFKEKFINFTHQPQFHLPLVLPPSNSLQSLPQPINQPLLCKGNASHGGSQQAWNIKLRQDRDPSQCIKGDQGIQP